ncbi:hypothetical protein A3A69_02620 [candidate division WWE3 bacterium RIFCSPLOWO2_01_FULL_37_15]|uniref:Uncharacterized protein n=1 Tax=candidate division WWE3 bacterium RIFCSPLOWO2_01_FULL_37_15 TaxID=1802622 RepID=A0A1F4V0B7_UNCKA|nr:MAG: hypothetical protein A3A69_02620 [candidate division WWE3 bacterium RIFCSPLOWO2_01_FULL_37_15]
MKRGLIALVVVLAAGLTVVTAFGQGQSHGATFPTEIEVGRPTVIIQVWDHRWMPELAQRLVSKSGGALSAQTPAGFETWLMVGVSAGDVEELYIYGQPGQRFDPYVLATYPEDGDTLALFRYWGQEIDLGYSHAIAVNVKRQGTTYSYPFAAERGTFDRLAPLVIEPTLLNNWVAALVEGPVDMSLWPQNTSYFWHLPPQGTRISYAISIAYNWEDPQSHAGWIKSGLTTPSWAYDPYNGPTWLELVQTPLGIPWGYHIEDSIVAVLDTQQTYLPLINK